MVNKIAEVEPMEVAPFGAPPSTLPVVAAQPTRVAAAAGGGPVLAACKYWKRAILVTLIGVGIALIFVRNRQQLWTSVAKILVRRTSVDLAEENPNSIPGGFMTSEGHIMSQMTLITSRDFHRRVARRLMDERAEAARSAGESVVPITEESVEFMASGIGGRIATTRDKRSPVVLIIGTSDNPKSAKSILDAVIAEYLEFRRATPDLDRVIKEARENVETLEGEYSVIEDRWQLELQNEGIFDLGNATSESRRRVLSLRGRLQLNSGTMREKRKRLDVMKEQLAAMPDMLTLDPITRPNPQHGSIVQGLNSAKDQLATTLFKPGTPQYQILEERIEALEASLEDLPETISVEQFPIRNSAKEVLKQQVAFLVAEIDALDDSVKETDAEIKMETERFEKMSLLRDDERKVLRELSAISSRLESYKSRVVALEEQRNLVEANVFSQEIVLQSPTLPFMPDGKPNLIYLAVGLAIALGAGVFVAAASGIFDGTLRAPAELQKRTSITPLGVIPDMRSRSALKKARRRLGTMASESHRGEWPSVFTESGVVSMDLIQGRFPVLTDTLDLLIARLRLTQTQAPKVIGFASCDNGAGVTTLVANLGIRLAQRRRTRVLIIEWNHRRPAFLHPEPGGANGGDVRSASPVPLLTEGGADLLHSSDAIFMGQGEGDEEPNLGNVLALLKARYDVILVDNGPILASGETVGLVGWVDEWVMVVRANRDSTARVIAATDFLADSGERVAGAVLTRRRYLAPSFSGLDGPV